MNKRMISLMAAALALLSASGQVSFTGVGEHPVIELTPESTTGLNKIYVIYDVNGVTMNFDSYTGERAKWEYYDYRSGSLDINPVPDIRWNGMSTSLDRIIPNVGYKIQDGDNSPFFCWVVNYVDYPLELNDLFFGSETPCNLVSFDLDGQAPAIDYYVNRRRHVIDRQIELKYNTLEFVEDSINSYWDMVAVVDTFPALDQAFQIEPPLCNTVFLLTGDRFLREWNMEEEGTESDLYMTQAVDCEAMAWQENHDGTYSKVESTISDGSAPVHVLFKGFPTEAAVYRAWQIADDPEFENIILQYNQDELDYSFTDVGTVYVRYMVANASGTCEETSDYYTINVGVSSIGVMMGGRREVSNVFSPGTTPGVNDIWKVPTKSLVEFHCWIFNRWGNLVYEFTDPDGGWDGTYKGKLVDPGVFYYVAKGLGSDGVSHEKRGDITIINYNQRYGADPMGGNGATGGTTGTGE